MDAAVSLRSVSKSFHGNPVVSDLSLDIPRGEFFSILGASGSGKSTTLRLIAGFEPPDSGAISVCGQPISTDHPPFAGPVNMVFQNYALFPHLTAGENVAFGLRMQGINRADRDRAALAMLALVRLDHLASRLPSQLSGGQQQRVALARALATNPEIVLLDEPLGALDLRLRREMQHELRDLQQSRNLTFIYVTHDQEEALGMSSRLTIMDHGRIIQTGSPHDLYLRPASRFAAAFLGDNNFLAGTLAGTDSDSWLVSAEGLGFRVPRGQGAPSAITLAIRPEHLHASGSPGLSAIVFPPARVTSTVFSGASTRVSLLLPSGTSLTALIDSTRPAPEPGTIIAPWCRPESVWPIPDPPSNP